MFLASSRHSSTQVSGQSGPVRLPKGQSAGGQMSSQLHLMRAEFAKLEGLCLLEGLLPTKTEALADLDGSARCVCGEKGFAASTLLVII